MVVEDGTAGHLFAMCGAVPARLRLSLPRQLYSYLVTQITLSQAWALFDDAEDPAPFALVGLGRLDDGSVEGWCIARAGGLPGHLLLGLVRFARQQFNAAQAPAVGLVFEGNANGERLARLCGFSVSDDRFGAARVWRRPG